MSAGQKGGCSGCRFPSSLTTQLPVYDNGQPKRRKRFKKKLTPGRPSNKKAGQHWVA
jgi:hypothetical protein